MTNPQDTPQRQANRKDDHVTLATHLYSPASSSDFEQTRFVHHSLSSVDWDDISIATSFGGMDFSSPFFISAMTGGSQATHKINQDLAIVARETGLAIASGSLSIALKDASTMDSFTIMRKENPSGKIFANLGAHHTLENAKRAVDMIQADALQIHLNRPQELIMPEGDRDFSSWQENIESIVAGLDVPVFVKEVGFGMSRETVKELASLGVSVVDVAGNGGTNFAAIENSRRSQISYDYLENWGQSTMISLLEAMSINECDRPTILASGGIKTPMDMVKSLAMGAQGVGVSGQFLHLIQSKGVEETIAQVKSWQEQLKTILSLLGVSKISDLRKTDMILSSNLQGWANARQIPWKYYAKRSGS